jgi:lipopolysaccharide transport system permease protein
MSFINKCKEIYQYRHMLKTLVKQDINGRYKGSFFGFLWTLLNPLLMLFVYSLVFQFVFRTGIEHYSIYLFVLCLGMLLQIQLQLEQRAYLIMQAY